MSDNIVSDKSIAFAIRVVGAFDYMSTSHVEKTIPRQFLQSGTNIGAHIHEAQQGLSRKDFAAKMGMALREAAKTLYWLTLLVKCGFLTDKMADSLQEDCQELIRLLTSIINTVKAVDD